MSRTTFPWRACLAVASAALVSVVGAGPAVAAVRAPSVTSVSPRSGAAGGGFRVTIEGSSFRSVRRVTVGSVTAHFTRESNSRLVLTMPPVAPGWHNVRVTTASGVSPRTTADLYRALAPAVSGISPAAGPPSGGTPITIAGTRLDRVSRVYFGSVSTTAITHVSSTRLQVRTPRVPAGVVSVRVRGVDGTSSVGAAASFRFTSGPTAPHLVDPQVIDPPRGGVQWVSCASASFCAAADGFGELMTYSDGAWGAPLDVFGGPDAAGYSTRSRVACPSATFCLAVVTDGRAATWNGTGWSAPQPIGSFHPSALSCWSVAHCLLVDANGQWRTYTDGMWSDPAPVAAGQSFTPALIDVSCPSDTFCAAVGSEGRVYLFDGQEWSFEQLPSLPYLSAVSCTSANYCLAVGNLRRPVIYSYDGSEWSAGKLVGTDHETAWSVACVSPSSCLVVGGGWTPAFGSWAVEVDDGAASEPRQLDRTLAGAASVSCPTATFCAVVGRSGTALTRTDGTWATLAPLDPGTAELAAVSCPTTTFCAAADDAGNVMFESNGAWSPAVPVEQVGLVYHLTCASARRCALVDQIGHVWMYDGIDWAAADVADPSFAASAVSCASDTFCVATGRDGRVVTYSNGGWTPPVPTSGVLFLNEIACPTTTFCLATGGDALHRSIAVELHGGRWSAPVVINAGIEDYPTGLACASTSSCTVGFNAGSVATWVAGVWSPLVHLVGVVGAVVSLDCPTSTYCAAIDQDTSPYPIALDGGSARVGTLSGAAAQWTAALSCAAATKCTAVTGISATHS